jgi:hypothetical protein
MPLTTRSDLIVPEILEDALAGAFAGMKVLAGSPAAVMNASLPNNQRGGDTVKVPYFGTLGELEDVATEGGSLTPAALTMSVEQAAVQHSGKAFEMTDWAQLAAAFADPYAEGSRQLIEAVARRADRALIDAAVAGLPAAMTRDVWNAATPRTIDYDLVVDGRMLWGDEQEDLAMLVVHSKVLGDMYKLKDTLGRPLLTSPNDGGIQRFVGVPVFVSDRLAPDLTDPAHPKYSTLLLKRNALVFWYTGTPPVEVFRDVLVDAQIAAVHIYWVAYRYKRLPGYTRGGVALLEHN